MLFLVIQIILHVAIAYSFDNNYDNLYSGLQNFTERYLEFDASVVERSDVLTVFVVAGVAVTLITS